MVEVAGVPDEKGRILLNRTHEKCFTADPRNPPNLASGTPSLQIFFLRSTITPKSPDFVFPSEISKPSAAKPRRNNSRTAAARLGIWRLNRH